MLGNSLPYARAEGKARPHPCQQEEGGDWRVLELKGISVPVASAAQKLPDGTIPFGTETASLGVGVSHALPYWF